MNAAHWGVDDVNTIGFTYYPNPVNDILNIKTDISIESINTFNITGQQLMTIKSTPANGQIDLSSLASGMYLVNAVFENGQVETFKIIKE